MVRSGARLTAVLAAAWLLAGCGGASPRTGGAPPASPPAGGLASASPAPFADMSTLTAQPACPATGTYEDVYFPAWAGRPVPAILFIHGGSWMSGSRADVAAAGPLLSLLRVRGYAVVSIDYRLAPQSRWPAMYDDSRCALDNLRAGAGALGIDPRRIAVLGYSAGAQLALLLGLELPAANRPAAVIEVSGPTDLTRPEFATGLAQAVGGQVFGTTDAGAPVLRQASPVTYVRPGDPPVFILHGTADDTVPYAQALELDQALRAAGDADVLVPVPGAGHELGPAAAAAGARILSFLSSYFPA